jgi:DNA invertase Pin-like site-specific DNA recombinase
VDTMAEFGELVAAIFAFVASFERQRITERIKAGLERARAEGTPLGRPRVAVNRKQVWRLRHQGSRLTRFARRRGLSHGTVRRIVAAPR